ncbi:MAG TPA: ATP synthase subunit I [Armatimonadota bacterium]
MWLYSAVLATIVALGAGLTGHGSVALGYAGGVLISAVSLWSVVVTVYQGLLPVSVQPPTDGQRRLVLAVQALKYLVALGGLYLLAAHYRSNEWAIFFGLLTPVALATGFALFLPRPLDSGAAEPPEERRG